MGVPASSSSNSKPSEPHPSTGPDAGNNYRNPVKKKRARQTSPTSDPTGGLDPFATVPDGQQFVEQARLAAGLSRAVDTEAPTQPMQLAPPEARLAPGTEEEGGPDAARATGASGHQLETDAIGEVDMSRGVETFGRRAQNAYMPPSDPGYAPAPDAWTNTPRLQPYPEPPPHAWANSAPLPNGGPGYAQHQQPVFAPPNAGSGMLAQKPNSTAQLGLKPNFAAMLCYLPYLGIVGSILVQQNEPKQNRYLHYHARQSLVAHIVFWAITVAFSIAQAAAPGIAAFVIGLASSLFHIGSVVGLVWMMVRVYNGKTDRIPVIGDQVDV